MSAAHGAYVALNGRVLAASRARVSVFDRGLLYGDGLFETLRVYDGAAFALEAHLIRLRASARLLGLTVPQRRWIEDICQLLTRNRLLRADAWVRITLTRGVGLGLVPPQRIQPTLLITAGRLDAAIAKAQRRGARVTLLPFGRTGFLAEHKVLNYLPSVLGKVMAARHGAFEGIFVDARKRATEGTTSNLFIWQRGQLLTPPVAGILPGLTRRFVMETAVADGIRIREATIRAEQLLDAEEAFLTSSLAEVVPIVAVDAHRIGSGRVGSRTRRLQLLYRQMVDQSCAPGAGKD